MEEKLMDEVVSGAADAVEEAVKVVEDIVPGSGSGMKVLKGLGYGTLGVVVVGAVGYGIKKLYDKHKAKKITEVEPIIETEVTETDVTDEESSN